MVKKSSVVKRTAMNKNNKVKIREEELSKRCYDDDLLTEQDLINLRKIAVKIDKKESGNILYLKGDPSGLYDFCDGVSSSLRKHSYEFVFTLKQAQAINRIFVWLKIPLMIKVKIESDNINELQFNSEKELDGYIYKECRVDYIEIRKVKRK